MAIESLNLKIAAEKAIIAAHGYIAPLKFFATSFSEEAKNKGDAVLVPVFDLSASSEFNADTNNYAGTENGVDGVAVTLNQHLVKSVRVTDKQLADTDIDFFENAGRAIGERLGQDVPSRYPLRSQLPTHRARPLLRTSTQPLTTTASIHATQS